MIVCSLWMVPTFGLPWATRSHFTAINSRKVGFDTRWGCVSKQGIFAGGIFKVGLVSMLEYGERGEADGGYRGSAPEYVKCPKGVWGETESQAIQQRVRSRQETVNARFKNWAILVTPYRHDFRLHQTVFAAIIVLTQLSFEYNPLFSVDYND